MKKTLAVGMAVAALSAAQARELIWTGAVNNLLNHTDANWYVKGDAEKAAVAFADSDDVVFNDESTTDWIVLTKDDGQFKPFNVTFDITRDVVLTNELDCIVGWNTKSLTKKGTGRLIISDYQAANAGYRLFTTYGSGLTVEAGTLEFARRYHLRYYADSANDIVSVKNGATLVFGRAAVFEGEYVNIDPSKNLPFPKTHISIEKGGKLVIKEPYGVYGMYGPLTFNDAADFEFSQTKGYSTSSSGWGLFALTGKVTLNGSGDPYVWDASKTDNPTYNAINLCCSNTEFCVADVTGSPAEDFILKMQLRDHTTTGTTTLPGGLIKSGPGTMALTKTDNVFTGDILVKEGVLQCGPNDQSTYNSAWTFFGNPNVAGRTITAKEGAALFFPIRNIFGTQSGITNLCSNLKFTFVFDGGAYTNAAAQGFLLPNLEFRNGGTVSPGTGASGYGRFMVKEYFRVTGSKPFVWNLSAPTAAAAGSEALSLNGYPRNIFEIEDVTGDADPDATFHVPFIIANGFFRTDTTYGSHLLSDWAFGFTKRGPGTMRYAAAKYYSKNTGNPGGYGWSPYNGDTDVEEGTLQMDGDISFADTVNVAAGAYLSGTGTVNNVTLAAGAGLKVPAQQEKPLAVKGDFTLGANPVVDINLPAGAALEDVKAKILTAEGSIAGAENLKNATVRVNGEPTDKIRLTFSGNTLKCGFAKGLMLMVR